MSNEHALAAWVSALRRAVPSDFRFGKFGLRLFSLSLHRLLRETDHCRAEDATYEGRES